MPSTTFRAAMPILTNPSHSTAGCTAKAPLLIDGAGRSSPRPAPSSVLSVSMPEYVETGAGEVMRND